MPSFRVSMDANPQSIEDFKNGKNRAVGFLDRTGHESQQGAGKSADDQQADSGRIKEKIEKFSVF